MIYKKLTDVEADEMKRQIDSFDGGLTPFHENKLCLNPLLGIAKELNLIIKMARWAVGLPSLYKSHPLVTLIELLTGLLLTC